VTPFLSVSYRVLRALGSFRSCTFASSLRTSVFFRCSARSDDRVPEFPFLLFLQRSDLSRSFICYRFPAFPTTLALLQFCSVSPPLPCAPSRSARFSSPKLVPPECCPPLDVYFLRRSGRAVPLACLLWFPDLFFAWLRFSPCECFRRNFF